MPFSADTLLRILFLPKASSRKIDDLQTKAPVDAIKHSILCDWLHAMYGVRFLFWAVGVD